MPAKNEDADATQEWELDPALYDDDPPFCWTGWAATPVVVIRRSETPPPPPWPTGIALKAVPPPDAS